MKKSKIMFLCLIGVLLGFSLFLFGCGDKDCNGTCHQKSDGGWFGCTVLSHHCATGGTGGCAAWQDWTNDVHPLFSRGCNCN